MNLNLSPETIRLIEAKLAGGGFRDAADVVEQALRLLDEVTLAAEGEEDVALREAIAEGLASGEPLLLDPDNLKDHVIKGVPLRPL
jgi:putative addiction module CopG family antidote